MIKSTGALLPFAALSAGQAVASNVVLRGNLLDRPCYMPGDGLNKYVIFKTRASRDFWYPPGRSPTESFAIRLENCYAAAVDKTVTLTFKGTEEAALPGHLKVIGVNTGRLGIVLLDTDGSSLLKPGASRSKGQGEKVTGNSPEFPFGVHVVATSKALRIKSVAPGGYEVTATFELTYRQ